LIEQPFDVLQEWIFIATDEGNGSSNVASSTCATNAMHVVFWYIGQFKVDHMRELIDI
jgi:hypothetical protein